MIRFIRALVLLSALSPGLAFAQPSQTATLSTQYSAACSATSCMVVSLGSNSGVSIQVKGTWTGTLTPMITVNGLIGDAAGVQVYPSTSSTGQTTITANGVYFGPTGGGLLVIRYTTASSGSPTITVTSVQSSARSWSAGSGGGGGGSGTVTSVGTTSPITGGTFTDSGTIACATCLTTATGAPIGATYITQTPNAALTSEQALSALATGLLKNTTTTGVLSVASAGADYLTWADLPSPPGGTALGSSGVPFKQQYVNAIVINNNSLVDPDNIAVGSLLVGDLTYQSTNGPFVQFESTFTDPLIVDAVEMFSIIAPTINKTVPTNLYQFGLIYGSGHTFGTTGNYDANLTAYIQVANAAHVLSVAGVYSGLDVFSGSVDAFSAYLAPANGGSATNAYAFWSDERGVAVLKSVNDFDSVYQANWRVYNPLFTKYTAGAVDREYVVAGQWNGNVAEIGTVATGTGTLRPLSLIGSEVRVNGKSITLSGTLTTTGAFNPTFAIPSSSTWTFPSGGGTLVASSGAVTSIAGTSNQITASASTGAVTLSIPTNPVFSGTALTFPGTLSVASGKSLTASNTLTLTGTDASSVAFGAGGTVLYSTGSGSGLTFPGTLSIASGKTFTSSNTLTIAATDGITMTTPTSSFTAARTDAANTFSLAQTFAPGVGASAIAVTGATQTSSFPVLDLAQTWNASGTTFTALKLNVTNTAAATASVLEDLQVGSSTMWQLRKDGYTAQAGGVTLGGDLVFEIYTTMAKAQGRDVSGRDFTLERAGIHMASGAQMGWSATAAGGGDTFSSDTIMKRGGAAATFQMGADVNGTATSQTLQCANGITGTDTVGGNCTIGSGKGTGAGAISSVIVATPTLGSTGTTAQTRATRLTINQTSATFVPPVLAPYVQTTTLYSAAGTPLPTCNGASEGSRASVSDATIPTFLAAYVSGGAVHASVYCDGTSWKTD